MRDVVARALAEDLGVFGDLTAGLVPPGATVAASIVAREPGVLAGRLAASETFAAVDPAFTVRWEASDGDRLAAGMVLARVDGPLASVVTAERTALNLLGHLSGIASLTRKFVDAAGGSARIRDTRKTTPGLRALEKAAVRAGGGVNHRGSLSDGILVKDNHLAGLSIEAAVAAAHAEVAGRAVRGRVRLPGSGENGASVAGADLVLLDNMDPSRWPQRWPVVGGRVPVEVSGRVGLEDVAALRPSRRRSHLGRAPHPLGPGARHRAGPGAA